MREGRDSRPNIILIQADQHRADAVGFAGKGVHTPHLDRLTQAGARFDACITPNPVCQPARAALLTGLLPLTNGVWDNGVDLREEVADRGIGARLARAGYCTGLIGKAHFSSYYPFRPTGRPESREGSQHVPADWTGPYMGFQHVELAVEPHWFKAPLAPPAGLHFEQWLYSQVDDPAEMMDIAVAGSAVASGAVQTKHADIPVAWHHSTWTANRAIDYLRRRDEEDDGPFFLWASFGDPHHPFDAPKPWSMLHDPDSIVLPPHRTRDLESRPWWHRAALESEPELADESLREFRSSVSRVGEQTDEELRDIIANYYGMISLIDHNVGRILAEIRAGDRNRETYVFYTSDHGEWLGDHGLLFKGPMCYEGVLRVPLVAAGPGIEPGTVVTDPVSTLDLAATFYELAGLEADPALHSRSLTGLMVEAPSEGREYALFEWNVSPARCGVALELRGVRTRRYKLVVELRSGAAEMYDLERDPHELRNVADCTEYAQVRRDLWELIQSRPQDQLKVLDEPVGMS